MEISNTITYFSTAGELNTTRTFEFARNRALELGISTVLVASSTGAAGVMAADFFKGFQVIVVSHSAGFREANTQELTEDNRKKIEALSGRILTATHAFGGVNRAIRRKFNTYQVDEIIAGTLRILGQGFKVVLEIALMAADAGLVRTDTPVLCIAGTHAGADTAAVLIPAYSQAFFDLRLLEIICLPVPGHPGFSV
ncbi:MAG TPA: pyruvate kinase alpha/beta domain-containing protein [Anaerolineaceae bacterium]|nr:pyruvate kinase alpha/beta domain-containing protein [Anaerolineaceae bacterium]